MSIEVVQKISGSFLESPHWDDVTNTLQFVDSIGRAIHRYNPVTLDSESIHLAMLEDEWSVAGILPTRCGRTLVVGCHRIGVVCWKTASFETLVELECDEQTISFNGVKCDPAGRLWIGTMGSVITMGDSEMRKGALYSLDQDMNVTKHLEHLDFPSGMAWSTDGRTMFFIDALSHGVDAFDFDIESGEIGNRHRVINMVLSEGLPGGMCVDNEDMVWVAFLTTGVINRYNPHTGEKLRTIRFPTTNVTNCCWGGANFDELFVTSAKHYLTEKQRKSQKLAGSVFRVTGLGVKGVKCEPFNDL